MTLPTRRHPFETSHKTIREAVLAAVDPRSLVRGRLQVPSPLLKLGTRRIPLDGRRIWILSVGKAAVPMAQAAETALASRHIAGGVAAAPAGVSGACENVSVVESGHPMPTGTDAADAVEELAGMVGEDDLVICLLSGGGSALLAAPPDGVALEHLAEMTGLLLRSGADIEAINTVRRHVSRLQGGRLLALLHPATVITLVLSDVIVGGLRSIASGPTAEDPTTFADARDVLQRYGLWKRVHGSIRDHILAGIAGARDETPKPGDPRFARAVTCLLADNATAVDAACRAARSLGFDVQRSGRPLIGEARDAGATVVDQAMRWGAGRTRNWAWIGGGETVVTVRGSGVGGRNQEVAAAGALALDGRADVSLTSLATDGRDGPTDAAGALVDGETARRAREAGRDLIDALANNDCYPALATAGDLIHTGLTETNVADVCWVLGAPTR